MDMYRLQAHGKDREEIMIHFDIGHPLDIRDMPTDPALVDLQPYRDSAHSDRLQRERRQAERKREYLRAKYDGQGEIKTVIRRTGA